MRVGAFELDKRIGAGGMGEIWRGSHAATGVASAVKFDLHTPDDTWREAFLAEVRRIAELEHPNVVHIFDTGIVTAAEARAAGGQLIEGMPWLAMELARGGSLADDGNMPRNWAESLHVIRGLLSALAHAHAAGIVHRDIKPGNLLLAGARSSLVTVPEGVAGARIVLSDFGIGHDLDRPGWMDEQSVGTPRFMAPEQIEANWRDQGPWTDLYQSGILLWRLCTGQYPFTHKQSVQLYRAHLFSKLPPFRPNIDVPEGIEAICRSMLEKDHRARPQLVADVLEQLDALGEAVVGSGNAGKAASMEDAPTEVAQSTEQQTTSFLGPESSVVLDMGLRSAGLGLWGLRPLPLVDRMEARDTLWQALVRVKRNDRAHAVVLRGPAGIGKSRLAQWLSRRAHERGEAVTWRGRHTQVPDAEHGLAAMFRRELRVEGLPRGDAADRVRRLLGFEGDASAPLLLAWLLGPTGPGDRVPDPRERLALLRRALSYFSATRPLVVWLDDAHYAAEGLQLAQWVLREPDGLPVLFVATVRDEDLADRPDEASRVAALLEHADVTSIEIGPLGPDDQRALVRRMLGLEGRLAEEVERRTAGNPAFAVQLVNDWVESGRLVPGPKGFRLSGGIPEALPDGLLGVWRHRIDRLVQDLGEQDRAALELAAVLGMDIETRAWRAACALGGLRLRPGLVGTLLRSHLVRADSRVEHLRFAHGGVRAALLERVAGTDSERQYNDWCATLLLGGGGDAEQLASHLVAAGRLEEATEPLMLAIEARLSQGDMRSPRLLDMFERVLRDLPAPKSDERWGILWLNQAWFQRLQGNREEADRIAARAERAADRHGWKAVLGWALREAGNTAMDMAEYLDAIEYLERAEQVLEAAGRPESAAFCRTKMGAAFEFLGEFDAAEASFKSCLDAFDAEPRAWVFAAAPWNSLAQLAQKRGRLDEAHEYAEEARWRAERAGQHGTLAHIAMLEGEMARYRGDLDAADRYYRESIERYEAFHDPNAVVPALNLGVVGVLRGQYAETRAMMESLLRQLDATGRRPVFAAYARSVLLACCAALGDADAFDEHYDALMPFLEKTGVADPDILRLAAIAEEKSTHPRVVARARIVRAKQEARLSGAS
ncbi:MAG: protein kinase [Alphaproteobacteria bacterium]|nr:protein kinase [Alphaproteobacteria bacterium]